jgi:hypothetical protein
VEEGRAFHAEDSLAPLQFGTGTPLLQALGG